MQNITLQHAKVLLIAVAFNCLFSQTSIAKDACVNEIDSVIFTDYSLTDRSIIFHFYNSSDDTLYLFSSYFQFNLKSKYLNIIDNENKLYIRSFIPWVPYMYPVRFSRYTFPQIAYFFIELVPHKTNDIAINIQSCFSEINKINNVVFKYNYDVMKKFLRDKKKLKKAISKIETASFSKINDHLNLEFQFALYNKINLLSGEEIVIFDEETDIDDIPFLLPILRTTEYSFLVEFQKEIYS